MNKEEQPTVLVVNDDPIQLRFASAILEKDKLQVFSCQSAEDALHVLGRQQQVHVVVTDLHMPGIDGWRFCRLLRSPEYLAFNRVPILVTSATFSGTEAEQVTADLGANAFLPSPYKPALFRTLVRDLLEGRKPQAALGVLIVEDSPTLLTLLSQAFAAHGYLVHTALTGQHGQLLFHEHAPEIVVLDYYLPDMTGDRLLTEFKQPGSQTVVIIMTSDDSPERAIQVIKQGADGYVRKPFDPEYLIELCVNARRQRSLLRVEELLQARTKELERQRADFLAMLAHDIKNPLGVILGCTEILLEEAHDRTAPEEIHFLERLQSNAMVIHSLVSNYLDFSRSEAGQLILTKQPLDLRTVLLQVITRYEAEARRRGISLTLCIQPELPVIEGDPLALERVFANLIHNALKFTPERGQVTVSTTLQNGDIAVTVSDTGPGIAPHEISALFERFRRAATNRHREGIGLGLFIVKALVEAHNGRVEIDSTLGQGSRFTVRLPLEDSQLGEVETREV